MDNCAQAVVTTSRDPSSLVELDARLVELMERAEAESAENGDIPETLSQEIGEYLEAFRTKIDRIAGYWRWQESIALICGKEAERLAARKRAANNRLARLKGVVQEFMQVRGLSKIEGEKSSVGLQRNSEASLVIDDPLQIADAYWDQLVRLTKPELDEILAQLSETDLKRQLTSIREGKGWEINSPAVRAAIVNGAANNGARLVRNHHLRLR